MMLGDLIEISWTENLNCGVNVRFGKENISVSEIEKDEKYEIERAKKIKDIHNNPRIMERPTVLFTLIHMEMAKAYLRNAK